MAGGFKSLSAAAPGEGDYHILQLDGERYAPWPPRRKSNGKAMMGTTRENIAYTLWVLGLDFDGTLTSTSGLCMNELVDAINARRDGILSRESVQTAMADAISLGLLRREGNARRTMLLELMCPPSQLPMPCPFDFEETSAARTQRLLDEAATREADGSAVDLPNEIDLVAFAGALLDEVVRRASATVEVEGLFCNDLSHEHYQRLSDRLRGRIRTLEQELDLATGVLKSTRVEVSEERRLRERVEDNLREALTAMATQQERLRHLVDPDTQRSLAALMRSVPGFEAYARNGKGLDLAGVGNGKEH